ncbi:hypothetical protein Tco_1346212 [Tanacetum coccineum]
MIRGTYMSVSIGLVLSFVRFKKAIEQDPSNSVLKDEVVAYVQAFKEAKIDEERFLRQKSKIEWLEVGLVNVKVTGSLVKMDDPNITMEEYIRLEEIKARRRGKVFNWETAKYGKIWYDEDVHDLRSIETEFPAIVFNDTLTSEATLRVSPWNNTAYPRDLAGTMIWYMLKKTCVELYWAFEALSAHFLLKKSSWRIITSKTSGSFHS